MKRYSIYINGYGAEVTQGSVTNELAEKILEKANETPESDISSAVFSIDIDDDYFDWWEIDDNFHRTGPYLSDSTLYVEDEDQNVIYEIPCADIKNIKVHVTYDMQAPDGFGVLTCFSVEKGTFWHGYIEVDEFDPSLLELNVDCLEDTEVVASILYNEKEILDLDHYDTVGKTFLAYLD